MWLPPIFVLEKKKNNSPPLFANLKSLGTSYFSPTFPPST